MKLTYWQSEDDYCGPFTSVDVGHAVVEKASSGNRQAVITLLKKFGATNTMDLKLADVDNFMKELSWVGAAPPPSDDHLIGLALGGLQLYMLSASADERGMRLRDKLNECGLAIVRVEEPAAQDPPLVPLRAMAFGAVVRLVGGAEVSGEYLVCVDHMSSSFNRVLVKLDNGHIQRVYQDTLVQLIRSHV